MKQDLLKLKKYMIGISIKLLKDKTLETQILLLFDYLYIEKLHKSIK